MKDLKNEFDKWIGGFPRELFENERIKFHIKEGNAANGGGWIGRHERTPARDRDLYNRLVELNLGEAFIAVFLTSVYGRWYAESIKDGYKSNSIRYCEILGQLFLSGCKEGWLEIKYTG